ncbi:MAG: chromate transporter [Lachnospiraceae bacterium]|nr:chromate transporter [Lachnospiraceae bacterium]
MIYLELILGFLHVGCFSFGGAYGAIPLIRDIVLSYGWMNDETLTYMIAISESTPGPIMVNLATYIGSSQAGFLGAVLATLSVISPSFIIMLLVMAVLKTLQKNKYVQAVMRGLKSCIIGIILATGVYMTINNCFSFAESASVNIRAIIIAVLLITVMFGAKIIKKRISSIMLIVISACLGIVIYGI